MTALPCDRPSLLGALLCRLGLHARTVLDVVPLTLGWRWRVACRRPGCAWRAEVDEVPR